DNESVTGNYGFNIQLQSTEPVVEEEVLDASTYTNLTFSVLDANAKTLSVAANGSPSGDLVIPNKVIFNDQQYIITCIKDNGFYDCWDITSVSLPNSLTSIGNYAFGSCIFTSIIIPSSVVSMGNGIFDNSSLKTLIISSGVTTIGESAFLNTYSLTSVTIHSSVISIGSGAFASCNKLSTVNYTGTEEQWASITIESGNDPLTNATKVYNYQG
ncbi:MAG: leucine-rich repeat domain-containing protein, partial [Clostridiales bacterium]|nr:leucine-rich repeat domain-containing protein [Clostridiales bacterium]